MEDKIQQRLEEMAEKAGIDLALLNEHQSYELYVKAEQSVLNDLAAFGDMMRDRTKEEE